MDRACQAKRSEVEDTVVTRRLSLHHLSMLAATPEELVRAARAGGFQHCGIRLVAPDLDEAVTDIVGDPVLRRRLLVTLRDEGISVLDAEALWLRRETDIRSLEPVLDAAAEIGATYFLTVGFDENRSRLVDTLGRFADLAAQRNILVPLEFISYTSVKSLTDAVDVIAAVNRENLRMLIDSLQFFRTGADFETLDRVPSHMLPYAQIADGPVEAPTGMRALRREARTARITPGEGELDLPRLLDHLPPGIPLAVESPTANLMGLPFNHVAQHLGEATRRLLEKSSRWD